MVLWIIFTDLLRQYLTQLRQELGLRLCDKVYDSETGKASKVSSLLKDHHCLVNYVHMCNCFLISVVAMLFKKEIHG